MEAVGAAAAIAELSGLSLRAGKAAKSLMQSFAHAPEEIVELNTKLERLRIMIQQIEILCTELPTTESNVLLPSEHRVLLTFSLQRTVDSLTSLKSAAKTSERQGVRERLRWAALDKKKAQRFLQDIRSAELEMDFILQILSVRLSSINQNSIATLAASQSSLQAALTQSMEEMMTRVSREISRLQVLPHRPSLTTNIPIDLLHKPTNDSTGHAAAVQYWIPRYSGDFGYREEQDDPIQRLTEHDYRRTTRHHEITVGNPVRGVASGFGSSSVMAAASISQKRTSTKVKLLISIGCRLFGESVLKFELQVSMNCRSWSFGPRLASYFTILNLRPSQSPIFVACRQYNLDEVRYLIRSGQASIRDIDEGIGGLLEHVILGRTLYTGLKCNEHDFLRGGQQLLEYLLDQGADPSVYLEGSENQRPAVLAAFEKSYTAAITSMISHGADLIDFGNQLAGTWVEETSNEEAFIWKVKLLKSLGYSDWQTNESAETLLFGACWHRHMHLTLFALEVAQIDPNLTGRYNRAPLSNAAQEQWLEGVAVLIEAGAYPDISSGSWDGTPLLRSCSPFRMLTDTSHFLLRQGADPNAYQSRGITVWNEICNYVGPWFDGDWVGHFSFNNVPFIVIEGALAHLLHHDADPFGVFRTTNRVSIWGHDLPMHWYDQIGYVRAIEAFRFWSYGIEKARHTNDIIPDCAELNSRLEKWKQELHSAESTRNFKWTFGWDRFGNIWRSNAEWSVEDTNSEASTSLHNSDDTDQSETRQERRDDDSERDINLEDDAYSIENDDMTDSDNSSGEEGPEQFPGSNFDDLSPDYFRNATAFYRHISNEQGRRQLSRFPMVRAFCDALQHAGYRAEMDDDGDIWYDCDDGDRYFDAWEAPIDGDDPAVWLPKVCPICQDFPGYGLGHILERAERGKQQYYEYKEQVRQGKRALYI